MSTVRPTGGRQSQGRVRVQRAMRLSDRQSPRGRRPRSQWRADRSRARRSHPMRRANRRGVGLVGLTHDTRAGRGVVRPGHAQAPHALVATGRHDCCAALGCARRGSPAAPAQYGFSDPPYSYDREYEQCTWPDNGTGRRYRPGYIRDRCWCWPESEGSTPNRPHRVYGAAQDGLDGLGRHSPWRKAITISASDPLRKFGYSSR